MKLTRTQIILLAGAGIVLIYLIQKGVFKADKGYNLDPEQNAQDGSTPTMDNNQSRNIAVSHRNALLDNNIDSSIFVGSCRQLLGLTDANLLSVSNAYNSLYVNDSYNTLRSLITQEWTIYSDSIKAKNDLLQRYSRLGI